MSRFASCANGTAGSSEDQEAARPAHVSLPRRSRRIHTPPLHLLGDRLLTLPTTHMPDKGTWRLVFHTSLHSSMKAKRFIRFRTDGGAKMSASAPYVPGVVSSSSLYFAATCSTRSRPRRSTSSCSSRNPSRYQPLFGARHSNGTRHGILHVVRAGVAVASIRTALLASRRSRPSSPMPGRAASGDTSVALFERHSTFQWHGVRGGSSV